MRPEDIVHEYRAKGLALSEDGQTVVFSMQKPTLRGDGYSAQLWRLRLDNSELQRLTRGPRDLMPKFSPDGNRLAFMRPIDGVMQLMVMPIDGGEPFPLTSRGLGVGDFAWSPNSERISYISRESEPGRYGTVQKRPPQEEPARLIESVQYLVEGLGYSADRPGQVFTVDVPTMSPELDVEEKDATGYDFDDTVEPPQRSMPPSIPVTNDDRNYLRVHYGAHDSEIVVLREVPMSMAGEMVALDPSGQGVDQVMVPGDVNLMIISCTALGDNWFFTAMALGSEGTDMAGKNAAVYRFDTATESITMITDPNEYDFGEVYSVLRADGEHALLGVVRERGTTQLVRVTSEGETQRVTHGDHEVKDIAAAAKEYVIVVSDATTVDEIAVVRNGGITVLTDFSKGLRDAGIRPLRELEFIAPDGTAVHGWVVLPEGDGPHPVLVNIHGGPHAQYTSALFDEAQVYASAGYAVVMCNPRGSAGYGESFARSVLQRMGTVDMQDILGFLDYALSQLSQLDAQRVGVMGGSYGGYMSAWLLANEQRFAAGIVERGFLDPLTFSGVSDIGWFFRSLYVGDDDQGMRDQSPYARIKDVGAPTLVIHSENDLRCPIEAAQRYFYELKRNGVETEMLIFPGEGHELTRAGRPRHRVQRFHAILDWWERHLPVKH